MSKIVKAGLTGTGIGFTHRGAKPLFKVNRPLVKIAPTVNRLAVPLSTTMSKHPKAAIKSAPATKLKQNVAADQHLTPGMRQILELHKRSIYDTSGYTQRTCQRHRKYFLQFGIDLRKPHRLPASLPVAKVNRKIDTNLCKKKYVRPMPVSFPTLSNPKNRGSL